MKNLNIIRMCFENICKNYNLPAGLHISEPIYNRVWHDVFQVFVDVHTCSTCNFYEKEIWKNFLKSGIKSKEDYRKLRSLVRTRLIDTIWSLRNLTEESLRNLGVQNICQEN